MSISNISTAALNLFDPRTGHHSYKEGDVWSEHDGPAYRGTFHNRGGKAVPVEKMAEKAYREPVLKACLDAGILDLGVLDRDTLQFLRQASYAYQAEQYSQRVAREAAYAEQVAQASEIVRRGSWAVKTISGSMEGWSVHPTKAEAMKVFSRIEEGDLLQGEFSLHRGGYITARGRQFLRDASRPA